MRTRVAVLAVAVLLIAVRIWYFLPLGGWLWLMLITAAVQFAVIVAGLVALRRRPDSRVGLILLAWGLFVLLNGPGTAESGLLLAVEGALQPLYWTLLAHAMLTYPDGRTHSRRERVFLAVTYLWPLVWLIPWLFAEPGWMVVCPPDGCPDNPLLISPERTVVELWFTVNDALAIGLGAWFLALVALRRRGMAAPQRRSAAPALWAIGVLTAAYLMYAGLSLTGAADGDLWAVMWWTRRLATLLVPVGLLIALVNTKLARADVATLLVRLRTADIAELQSGLATLLRDPSLRIVAGEGGEGDVTDLGDGYTLHHHRSARTEDPELFEAGVAAARMTIENARLHRQVHAQLDEVRASRERLVQAADAERRRVERDLHDGAQQQLIGVGMALETARMEVPDTHPAAAMLDDASGQLRQSIDELRALARGLRPAMLTERGLSTALAELRRRARADVTLDVAGVPRLATDVETAAYFVVSEALQNAVRHAAGARVHIRVAFEPGELVVQVRDDGHGGADVRGGSGLRGLADRVTVVGGAFGVHSPPGGGTTVEARIPAQPVARAE
ncbi:histidine kinase [Dactylosporangium sp. NBC_01737]|uniref:sensor histidine kinase n=1 Tax=Dactylosporangium sp. NBC_01737 TaxID=2975959 RepID=UPI002E11A016|nr:histidine kinase [Dactylosporangium sp. NBC_01737]